MTSSAAPCLRSSLKFPQKILPDEYFNSPGPQARPSTISPSNISPAAFFTTPLRYFDPILNSFVTQRGPLFAEFSVSLVLVLPFKVTFFKYSKSSDFSGSGSTLPELFYLYYKVKGIRISIFEPILEQKLFVIVQLLFILRLSK